MKVRPISATGEALAVLELAELPRAGDTLSLPDPAFANIVWRVRRVHWPITNLDAANASEAVELHICRSVHSVPNVDAA